jgi:hypothetical protein
VRTLLALLCGLTGLCLIAAAPKPAATLRPLSKPLPLGTPSIHLPSIDPVVLIYPFDSVGGLNAKVGTQLADIFSREFTQSGHVKLLPTPSNVARTNYLTTAQRDHADYYVSGYATPIGDGLSVVMQVVSVSGGGVIVFSQTSQLYGVNDAQSLALTAHDAILQLAGVNVSVDTTQSTTPAPSPQPTNGATFNLSHLFSHHGSQVSHAAATPQPTSKPARGVIFVAVRGSSLPTEDVTRASSLLYRDLAAHFAVRNDGPVTGDLSGAASGICGTNRDNTIATGTLSEEHVGGIRPRTKSVFTLQIWTCFGDVLYTTTKTDFDVAKAISSAVNDYVLDHPDNN